jgi:hypothetical protein
MMNVKTAFDEEMALTLSAEAKGDLLLSKNHLERAHILGQRWYLAHIKTHFHMLRLAMKQSDNREVRGQNIRLIGITPFHIVGWTPVGNTGGADVSRTLPMPRPSDFQPYFKGYSLRRGMLVRASLLAALGVAYMLFLI